MLPSIMEIENNNAKKRFERFYRFKNIHILYDEIERELISKFPNYFYIKHCYSALKKEQDEFEEMLKKLSPRMKEI